MRGLKILTSSAEIEDIGTEFGVRVQDGREEVHVYEGEVKLTGRDGAVTSLRAKQAASYQKGEIVQFVADASIFVKEMPTTKVLLKDDFDDGEGTDMNFKTADTGAYWRVLFSEDNRPLELKNGSLDTSRGARKVSIPLNKHRQEGGVYLLRVRTLLPERARQSHTKFGVDGAERISFARKEKPVMGILGKGSDEGHFWYLEKGQNEVPMQAMNQVSAENEADLTLKYDSRTGACELYSMDGGGSTIISKTVFQKDLAIDSILLMNHKKWGDLALDSIEVKVVIYP